MFNPKTLTIVSFLAISLTGCSGEPSEGDILDALNQSVEDSKVATEQMLGSNEFLKGIESEIHNVEKIGCSESKDSSGYLCDVNLDITAPFVGRNESIINVRLVETKNGWRLVE